MQLDNKSCIFGIDGGGMITYNKSITIWELFFCSINPKNATNKYKLHGRVGEWTRYSERRVKAMRDIKNSRGKLVCRVDEKASIVEIVHKGCKTLICFKADGTTEVINIVAA